MLDPLVVVIAKEDIFQCNISPTLEILGKILESPETARSYRERVDIVVHGFDDFREELFEISEVRDYVYKLDEKFPFWLYFLSKQSTSLHMLLLCFMPPYLTEEAKARIFPEKIGDILTHRWFPALNQIGEYVGIDLEENKEITERTLQYFSDGPL